MPLPLCERLNPVPPDFCYIYIQQFLFLTDFTFSLSYFLFLFHMTHRSTVTGYTALHFLILF